MAAELYEKLAARQTPYTISINLLFGWYCRGVISCKGKKLMQQASENGSPQARKALQRMEAQAQAKVSFIEPVLFD